MYIENLIRDIEIFVEKNTKIYNEGGMIMKCDYENLYLRITGLERENFQSHEKFEYFNSYQNQPQRLADRTVLPYLFNNNYLEVGPFLWMCNYLRGVANWLK